MRNYSCVVFGDINIDYVADLSEFPFHKIDNACINSSILTNIGGNATFFAEAALEAGFHSVKLFCSLGKDIAAENVKIYFKDKKIELISSIDNEETGKVLILYQPDDKRILVADRGANKNIFSHPEKSINDFIYSSTDLLYISGYILQNNEANIKLSSIIEKYKANGSFSIIDAVPHDLFHVYSWDTFVNRCQSIDGIVIEIATVFGFMKQMGFHDNIDEVANFLLSSFNFCLVRLNSESDFLIANSNNQRIVRINYMPRIASLRFTDRAISQIIIRYINNPNEIFKESDWIKEINEMIGEIK